MAARASNGLPNVADLDEEYNIKWNNHSHEALHVVNQLRAHDAFTDVLLYAEETWFKANKMILAACSGYFQQLFLDMQVQSPARVPAVIAMRETRADLLQLALDFMYKGEVLVPSNSLHDFMDFAEEMQIRGLRRDPGLPNAMVTSAHASPAPGSPAEKNNNSQNGPRIGSSSANGSPPPAKKMRTLPKLEAVKLEGEPIAEVASDEELENEGEYMDMNDFREEGSVQGAKPIENPSGGNVPAFIPPEISTEDPVQRITGVTWRGTHSMTRAQWHFCGLCGYSARYQAALMRHERVHTGEKPFKCEMCERRFTTKYWQQYHQRNSHPEVFGPNTSVLFPAVNLVGAEGGAESC